MSETQEIGVDMRLLRRMSVLRTYSHTYLLTEFQLIDIMS